MRGLIDIKQYKADFRYIYNRPFHFFAFDFILDHSFKNSNHHYTCNIIFQLIFFFNFNIIVYIIKVELWMKKNIEQYSIFYQPTI